MQTTMMNVPLSINHFLDRAGTLFKRNTIVSRLPDKSLRTHTCGQWHRRTLQLVAAPFAADRATEAVDHAHLFRMGAQLAAEAEPPRAPCRALRPRRLRSRW